MAPLKLVIFIEDSYSPGYDGRGGCFELHCVCGSVSKLRIGWVI